MSPHRISEYLTPNASSDDLHHCKKALPSIYIKRLPFHTTSHFPATMDVHLLLFLLSALPAVAGATTARRRLFAFGDSYADTGNLARTISPSWNDPYGMTFPRHPAGRFSDGRVLTDYVASSLGIKSPLPYKFRKVGKKLLPFGMNFAVGGSGVFPTGLLKENLTMQIDAFGDLLAEGVFSRRDLNSSTAFVSISGNDYVNYQDNGGTMEGLKAFTPKLVGQLKVELKRLTGIGVAKVAVTNLHPIGCSPYITNPVSNRWCNDSVNLAVSYHNQLLEQAVQELNDDGDGGSVAIIDLFSAFDSVLRQQGTTTKFTDVLKPCCLPTGEEYRCGYVGLDGTRRYAVCQEPGSKFYWDSVHPTQAGWSAVLESLRPSLDEILAYV